MLSFFLAEGSRLVEWSSKDIITYLLIGALIISLFVAIIIFFNRPEYQAKNFEVKKPEPKKPDPTYVIVEDEE